ncbi:hypothetical protein LCGC14_1138130, partial [marine sediment metagenome]
NFPIEINPKTEALPAEILIFSTFTILDNKEIKLRFIPSKFFFEPYNFRFFQKEGIPHMTLSIFSRNIFVPGISISLLF